MGLTQRAARWILVLHVRVGRDLHLHRDQQNRERSLHVANRHGDRGWIRLAATEPVANASAFSITHEHSASATATHTDAYHASDSLTHGYAFTKQRKRHGGR